MHKKYHKKITARTRKKASLWFARSRAENFSKKERGQLKKWLSQNSTHKIAFQEIESIWMESLHLKRAPFLSDTTQSSIKKTFRWRGNPQWAAVAASVVLIVFIAFLFGPEANDYRHSVTGESILYTTINGEVEKITLSDGSRLEINKESIATISFNRWRREIFLETGDVFLEVTPNPKRPLFLKTQRGQVKVLGTSFHVSNRNGHVAIDVKEGRVQVTTQPKSKNSPEKKQIITGGQGIDYNESGEMTTPRKEKLTKCAAWRTGKIIFQSDPLISVLAKLRTHYKIKVVLLEENLKEKRFTGTFKDNAPKEIVKAIQETFNLIHTTRRDGTIILKKR